MSDDTPTPAPRHGRPEGEVIARLEALDRIAANAAADAVEARLESLRAQVEALRSSGRRRVGRSRLVLVHSRPNKQAGR